MSRDNIVPDWDLPDHMRKNVIPPMRTADIPPRELAPAPAPEAVQPQLTPDMVMEMIAQKLSGPVRDMYDAEISRGTSHDDALMRVLDTTAGQSQARNAYREIMKELQQPAEPTSSKSPRT